MQTTQLKTKQLGDTGLKITRVGFGAWAIGGGGWEFGWGPQEDDQSIAAIHGALERGINWIDTAAAYGFGHSEELVGRALQGLSERPHVFTKASLLEGPGRRVVHNLKRDSIMREAHASLERLGVDAIDLYQIHWPIPEEDIEEGWSAFAELKQQGLVRHIGLSNFEVEQLRRIEQIAPVETLQPQYSLIERDIERDILPFAEQEGIGVIVYSPMGSGLLTGRMTRQRIASMPDDDWRKLDSRFREPRRRLHRLWAPEASTRAPCTTNVVGGNSGRHRAVGAGRYGSGWPRAFRGPMARAKMCMPLMRPLAGILPPAGRVMACTVLPALSGADV